MFLFIIMGKQRGRAQCNGWIECMEFLGQREVGVRMAELWWVREAVWLNVPNWKVLEQTMKMGATTSTYFPLSQLEVLGLYQINDLKSLPNKRLQNLISLWELYIKRFNGLGSLYWIGILTSPQSLNIWECPKLMSLHKGFAISHLYMN